MNEDRFQSVAVASILLLVIGLGVQSFGHVCHAGDSPGSPPLSRDASYCKSIEITTSDECPACILTLQGQSLGPPTVASVEQVAPNGPVHVACSLDHSTPCASSTVARAPPYDS